MHISSDKKTISVKIKKINLVKQKSRDRKSNKHCALIKSVINECELFYSAVLNFLKLFFSYSKIILLQSIYMSLNVFF